MAHLVFPDWRQKCGINNSQKCCCAPSDRFKPSLSRLELRCWKTVDFLSPPPFRTVQSLWKQKRKQQKRTRCSCTHPEEPPLPCLILASSELNPVSVHSLWIHHYLWPLLPCCAMLCFLPTLSSKSWWELQVCCFQFVVWTAPPHFHCIFVSAKTLQEENKCFFSNEERKWTHKGKMDSWNGQDTYRGPDSFFFSVCIKWRVHSCKLQQDKKGHW